MDALSDVLRTTRLTGGVFLQAEFTDPWCLGVSISPSSCAPYLGDTTDVIPYHYVLDGVLRVQDEHDTRIELGPGEVVLFPRNDEHLLGGDLDLPPVSGDRVVQVPEHGGLATIRLGGGGACTQVVCGFLGGHKLAENPIIATLPSMLHYDAGRSSAADWIRSTFSYAAQEIAAGRMGSETVLARISELLFVEAVRRYAADLPPDQTGWLAALRDPYVSRALALLHGRIAERWTIDELGRAVGLSRSALAERFNELLGLPPMQYLANWRMQVAAQKLRDGNEPVGKIAAQVGYDSEAAFGRAFKRVVGVPPATWRNAS